LGHSQKKRSPFDSNQGHAATIVRHYHGRSKRRRRSGQDEFAVIREIVSIDAEVCDGCGLCVPACHEGALRIVDGKARLVSERLCDGLGACLGHCPRGAIRVEQREAAAFDASQVAAPPGPPFAACPGSRPMQFKPQPAATGRPTSPVGAPRASELTHWPVQLRLLAPTAPALQNARLLVVADCVPVAYADFHTDFLRGRAVVIACPKLDDTRGYVEKLAAMIAHNQLREITVVHMEVPCCTGILHAIVQARELAGADLAIEDVVIGINGLIVARRTIPARTEPENDHAPARGQTSNTISSSENVL
jgi:ferredoxin